MKQFLYLDTDIINSIIAQSEKGLVQEQSHESESSESKDTHIGGSIGGSGSAGGTFLKLAKAEANITLSGELEKEYSTGTTSREIISKVLHDAAFDIAYNYIEPKTFKVEADNSDDYGDYIELTRVFDFVDIDYLEKLFSKDGLIELFKKMSREEIQNEMNQKIDGLNRDQARTISKKFRDELKKLCEDSDKEYEEIKNVIVAFKKIMPYTRMLISHDGYLIPLEDKYFRVSPESLGFKYGGEITCVGMITNIIGADTDPNDSQNIFATLQFKVNELLRMILPTSKENLCVIHPIAVFYGK